MSHAIHCQDCEEYVWPPLDAEGPGGRTEIAAYELALQHVRESGHTAVHVVPGCYYVGDGRRPNAFDGERISPEDVAMPDKTKMARATAGAARRLRSVADDLNDGDSPERHARHLRRYADAVESNIATDQATMTDGGAGEFERESPHERVLVSIDDSWVEDGYRHIVVMAPESQFDEYGVPEDSAVLEVDR